MSGTEWLIGLGIAGLAMGGVGMGMQYSANKQAAANQAAMARYNYAIQEHNIRQQQAIAQQQANYQASIQEANAAIAQQTANANALSYQQEADAALRQGVEDQRRTREEQLRFTALQRAGIGKSGVAGGVGTPLENLAESKRTMELTLANAWYGVNLESDRFMRAKEMELYGARVDAANYGMQAALSRNEGALAPVRARMQMMQAGYERLAGLTGAANTRSAATAGLVSGFGTVLMQGYNAFGGPSYSSTPRMTGSGNPISMRPAGLG